MANYKCTKCGEICDLIEVDEGGYEEWWGARVWRQDFTDYSDCCKAEFEEVVEDEVND